MAAEYICTDSDNIAENSAPQEVPAEILEHAEPLETEEDIEAALLEAMDELEAELAKEFSELAKTAPEPTAAAAENTSEPDQEMSMLIEPRSPLPRGAGYMHADFIEDFHAKPRRQESAKPLKRKRPIRHSRTSKLIMKNADMPFNREEKLRQAENGFGSEAAFMVSYNKPKSEAHEPSEVLRGQKEHKKILPEEPAYGKLSLPPLSLQIKNAKKADMDISDATVMNMEDHPSPAMHLILEEANLSLLTKKPFSPPNPVIAPTKVINTQAEQPEQPQHTKFELDERLKQIEFDNKKRPQQQQPKQQQTKQQQAGRKEHYEQNNLNYEAKPKQQKQKQKQKQKQEQETNPQQPKLNREERFKQQKPSNSLQQGFNRVELFPKQGFYQDKQATGNMDFLKNSFSLPKTPAPQPIPLAMKEIARSKKDYMDILAQKENYTKEQKQAKESKGNFAAESPRIKTTKQDMMLNMDLNNRGKSPGSMEIDSGKQKQNTDFKFSL